MATGRSARCGFHACASQLAAQHVSGRVVNARRALASFYNSQFQDHARRAAAAGRTTLADLLTLKVHPVVRLGGQAI